MKHFFFYALFVAFAVSAQAQVVRTSVVEHFTNTSCSVCANQNNGFYNIINNYPNTLHISFHPSSPYQNDFFNQQNSAENDARTNFYDVYGGTPQLVLDGLPIQGSTLNTSLSIAGNFPTYFTLSLQQKQTAAHSFETFVVIKKMAADTTQTALLFVGVVEDTIYQTTQNGETVHYNVFRKALTATTGNVVSLPQMIGDSVIIPFTFTSPAQWDTAQLHTMGILQKLNKRVINAAKTVNTSTFAAGIPFHPQATQSSLLYPNPSYNGIVTANLEMDVLQIHTLDGKLMWEQKEIEKDKALSISSLPTGLYLISAKIGNTFFYQKLLIP